MAQLSTKRKTTKAAPLFRLAFRFLDCITSNTHHPVQRNQRFRSARQDEIIHSNWLCRLRLAIQRLRAEVKLFSVMLVFSFVVLFFVGDSNNQKKINVAEKSTHDLIRPESPCETLNHFQRNLSALQDDDDDDPDDDEIDDNSARARTNETKRFPVCKQQNMHSHFRSSSLTFSLIPWSNFNVAEGVNTGSCQTRITMRNAESFPAQSICTSR